jgi:hypothetical protein
LADTLNAILKAQGGAARHVRDMSDYGFRHDTQDIEWIERLSADRPSDWIVITADDRIRRNKANRAAWLRAGLKGFILASGFQRMPTNQVASIILWRWPEMESFIRSAAARSMFELPVGRSSGFRTLSV